MVRDMVNKGNYLASLISIYPLSDLKGSRGNFFLKTLTEYTSSEGLVYCIINDKNMNAFLTLAPEDILRNIPADVHMKSQHAMGLTEQTFRLKGIDQTIHEFSKPIFENGQRAGIVRLGFEIPPVSIFSPEKVSLLAMIAFFIFSTGIIVYYTTTFALRPIGDIIKNFGNHLINSPKPVIQSDKKSGFPHIIKDLDTSFDIINDRLANIEAENLEISTRLGVINFEKKQISRIIDSLDIGIMITDMHEKINHVNSYMLNLLNKKRDEIINHPVGEIIEQEDLKAFIYLQGSSKQPRDKTPIETTFPQLAHGKTFQVSSTSLKDDEGYFTSNMISFKDITSQKLMESASQGFIAQVAHEFLTPLTTIRSYNEMLMDGEIEDREMQKDFFNTISEETGRLSRLIQNLLSIAKIEMGGLTIQKALLKSDWLIQDSLASVEGSALKKNITIIKNMPDNLPSLVGDKELLKISIINILGNAVKYCPENSTITISLHEQQDMVVFDISDTGYGISAEDLPHIFDKFYRAKDEHIKKQIGSGLGLAMTNEIIRLHGGEIDVQSEPGKGAQFTVMIPKGEYYLGDQ